MSLGLNEGSLILRWNCLTSGLHFLIGVYQTRVRGYYSPSIAAILILRDTWCTVEELTLPSPCPAKIPFFHASDQYSMVFMELNLQPTPACSGSPSPPEIA